MHFTYGRTNGNSNLTCRLSTKTYPNNRRYPPKSAFTTIYLHERGSLKYNINDCGIQQKIRTPELKKEILNSISIEPERYLKNLLFCTVWYGEFFMSSFFTLTVYSEYKLLEKVIFKVKCFFLNSFYNSVST